MTLTDAMERLARWRLRFSKLDSTVQYRKGARKNIADAVSRLPSYWYTETGLELEIPCVLIEGVEFPTEHGGYLGIETRTVVEYDEEEWEVEPYDWKDEQGP